jgi:hypothetical protein
MKLFYFNSGELQVIIICKYCYLIISEVFCKLFCHSNELWIDVDSEKAFCSETSTDLKSHSTDVAPDILKKVENQKYNLSSTKIYNLLFVIVIDFGKL